MNRKGFLKAAAVGAVAGSVLAMMDDGNQPVGHLTAETTGAMDSDHVSVDGQRVDHVFELDDVQGWVRHY